MAEIPMMSDPNRAWAPFEPGPGRAWDLASVAHLHRRAGFSSPWAILDRDVADGPARAVERLIEGEPTAIDGQSAADFARLLDGMGARLGPSASAARLRGIWLYRMIHTPRPLLERMTLFWHGHFATSIAKVVRPEPMQRQNDLLRSHALGDFKALLAAIGKDPAMLVWLDATANRRAKPNENYAREVMELFSLGRGRYTEVDVREVARAFTGRFVSGDRFSELPGQHDDGIKTILGKSGPFRGDDVPSILLDQAACAEFIAAKLFRQFISEVDAPSTALLAPLASAFRDSGYDVGSTVKLILRSNLFHDPGIRRRRVKSPVEFAVGSIRAMEAIGPTVSAEALGEAIGRMGQSLYAPPSVAGWDGGPAWISSAALIARTNFAQGLLTPTDKDFGGRCDPAKLADRRGLKSPGESARLMADLLVQDALDAPSRDRLLGRSASAAEAASVLLASPEYQLA